MVKIIQRQSGNETPTKKKDDENAHLDIHKKNQEKKTNQLGVEAAKNTLIPSPRDKMRFLLCNRA